MMMAFRNTETTIVESYRLELRQATHEYHVRLNRHPLLKDLTKPIYPLDRYKVLIFAYSLLYRSVEALIERFMLSSHVEFNYSERKKLPWLIKDIDYFQLDSSKLDPSKVSTVIVPDVHNACELAGLLYVIEGSTLGGQHISRALSDFHGITVDSGGCFFNGYGEQTFQRWKTFLEFLDSVIQDQDNFEYAKRTACSTFQMFESALDYCLVIFSK